VEWRSQQNVEEIGHVYCVSSLQYRGVLAFSCIDWNQRMRVFSMRRGIVNEAVHVPFVSKSSCFFLS